MKKIRIKRIYDAPSENDGQRILVDRIWPRGVSKKDAHLDDWIRPLAPSDSLRKWFNHDPNKFEEFSEKYRRELKGKEEVLRELREKAEKAPLTLLYGAKDTVHNQAVVLQHILEEPQ